MREQATRRALLEEHGPVVVDAPAGVVRDLPDDPVRVSDVAVLEEQNLTGLVVERRPAESFAVETPRCIEVGCCQSKEVEALIPVPSLTGRLGAWSCTLHEWVPSFRNDITSVIGTR